MPWQREGQQTIASQLRSSCLPQHTTSETHVPSSPIAERQPASIFFRLIIDKTRFKPTKKRQCSGDLLFLDSFSFPFRLENTISHLTNDKGQTFRRRSSGTRKCIVIAFGLPNFMDNSSEGSARSQTRPARFGRATITCFEPRDVIYLPVTSCLAEPFEDSYQRMDRQTPSAIARQGFFCGSNPNPLVWFRRRANRLSFS